VDRLVDLLGRQSCSAWQRAAYLLHRGNPYGESVDVLARRPMDTMSKVQFGDGPTSVWVPQFKIADRLIAPLQGVAGKA
jgi:hypothetical protein